MAQTVYRHDRNQSNRLVPTAGASVRARSSKCECVREQCKCVLVGLSGRRHASVLVSEQ